MKTIMIGKKINMTIGIILFYLFCWSNVLAKEPHELTNKIAFLRDGEVWISNTSGENFEQITNTKGKIEDFKFSPSLKYIAYSKRIENIEAYEVWKEGEAPCYEASKIIKNLKDGSIIKEITPSKPVCFYILGWQYDNELIFVETSGHDVTGYFEYDLDKAVINPLEYTKARSLCNNDFSKDGSFLVYVAGMSTELYLSNKKLNTDVKVVSKRSILDPKISHDKKFITFFEVKWSDDKDKRSDNVWLYSIKDATLKKIYTGVPRPKVGCTKHILWSLDNQYLGLFHPGSALIIDVKRSEHIHTINKGWYFHWTNNNDIIFSIGNDLFIYSLKKNKEALFLKNAKQSTFLWQ